MEKKRNRLNIANYEILNRNCNLAKTMPPNLL